MRRGNTSRYEWKKRRMLWRVEWVFQQAGVTAVDARVEEKAVLGEVLAAHVRLQPGEAARHHKLRGYSDAGVPALRVFMKKARCPANAAEYYEIDLQGDLEGQLAGRTVIEHPVFVVALPDEATSFTLSEPLCATTATEKIGETCASAGDAGADRATASDV